MDGLTPKLATENPFVEASRRGDELGAADYQTLLAASRLNEARVREALSLIAAVRQYIEDEDVWMSIDRRLEAAAFALGALLPPVSIKLAVPLGVVKTVNAPRAVGAQAG